MWTHNPNNPWQKIRTSGGAALAANYTEVFDDAYAYLGSWSGGNDYDVVATAYWPSELKAGEIEILLRVSDNNTQVHAYEVLYNVGGGWQVVRWNGNLGDYQVILNGGSVPGSGGHNGNQFRAKIVGSLITVYWRNSPSDAWSTLGSVSDSTYPTGKPGMAIYVHQADGNINGVGFQDYQVNGL